MNARSFRPCSICGEHRPDLTEAEHGGRTLALCPRCEEQRLAVIAAEGGCTVAQVREVIAFAAAYDVARERPRWDLEPAPRPLACICCLAPIPAGEDCWSYDGAADVTICRACGTPRAATAA